MATNKVPMPITPTALCALRRPCKLCRVGHLVGAQAALKAEGRGHNDRRDAIAIEAVGSTTLALPLTHKGVTWLERRRPSKLKGVVTMATVRMPIAFAVAATTGAAPLPVPPPMPACSKWAQWLACAGHASPITLVGFAPEAPLPHPTSTGTRSPIDSIGCYAAAGGSWRPLHGFSRTPHTNTRDPTQGTSLRATFSQLNLASGAVQVLEARTGFMRWLQLERPPTVTKTMSVPASALSSAALLSDAAFCAASRLCVSRGLP